MMITNQDGQGILPGMEELAEAIEGRLLVVMFGPGSTRGELCPVKIRGEGDVPCNAPLASRN